MKIEISDLGATTAYHALQITRTETLNLVDTQGGQNAPLSVTVNANNTSAAYPGSPIAQPVGILATVTQGGTGDAVGFFSSVTNASPGGRAAFGAFLTSNTTSATGASIPLGLNLGNDGGGSHSFSTSGPWSLVGIDIPYACGTSATADAAILIRKTQTGKFHTGIGFATGSTDAYLIMSDNFCVSAVGAVRAAAGAFTSLVAGNTTITPTSAIGGVVVTSSAASSLTFDVVPAANQGAYVRFGNPTPGVAEFAVNGTSGNWEVNFAGLANNVINAVRSGASPNTLLLAGGGISIGTSTAPGGSGQIRINNANFLMRNSASWANGAGTGSGVTFTNAPGSSGSTGNPTKWIAVDDNGTTRHIPAW